MYGSSGSDVMRLPASLPVGFFLAAALGQCLLGLDLRLDIFVLRGFDKVCAVGIVRSWKWLKIWLGAPGWVVVVDEQIHVRFGVAQRIRARPNPPVAGLRLAEQG